MRALILGLLVFLSAAASAQLSEMRVFSAVQAPDIGSRGDIASFSNGDLFVLLSLNRGNGNQFQVLRLNDKLQIIYSEVYSFAYQVNSLQVAVSGDTAYLAGNIRNEASTNVFFCALSADLQLLDAQVLENSVNYHMYTFDAHPQGGLYAIGFIIGIQGGTQTNVGNFITRFHGNGEINWFKRMSFSTQFWGLGGHTSDGDIIGTGAGSVWAVDAAGQFKWKRTYMGFNTIGGVAQVGQKLFVANFSYTATEQEMFCTHLDNTGYTPVDSYQGMSPQFIGRLQSECIVGSSYLTVDSVYLKLAYFGSDGKVKRQQIIPQAFGFALTGALYDACTYSYHLSADGIPYILGTANQMGFFVLKLGKDGSFECSAKQGFHTPGGQSGPIHITGDQALDHQTNYISLAVQKGNVVQFSDSLFCRYCRPIAYRLPQDTVLCPNDTLWISLPDALTEAIWTDSYPSKIRPISQSGSYGIYLRSECDTITDSIRVTNAYLPKLSIQTSDTFPSPGSPVRFSPEPDSFDAYYWYLKDSIRSIKNPWDTSFTANGIYQITLLGRKGYCYQEAKVQLGILEVDWYLPNVFTPNGDGLNETWGPTGRGLSHYTLKIFNRWGEVVFFSESENWDGTHRGIPVPDGHYLYVLQAYDDAGKKVNRKGLITVLR